MAARSTKKDPPRTPTLAPLLRSVIDVSDPNRNTDAQAEHRVQLLDNFAKLSAVWPCLAPEPNHQRIFSVVAEAVERTQECPSLEALYNTLHEGSSTLAIASGTPLDQVFHSMTAYEEVRMHIASQPFIARTNFSWKLEVELRRAAQNGAYALLQSAFAEIQRGNPEKPESVAEALGKAWTAIEQGKAQIGFRADHEGLCRVDEHGRRGRPGDPESLAGPHPIRHAHDDRGGPEAREEPDYPRPRRAPVHRAPDAGRLDVR